MCDARVNFNWRPACTFRNFYNRWSSNWSSIDLGLFSKENTLVSRLSPQDCTFTFKRISVQLMITRHDLLRIKRFDSESFSEESLSSTLSAFVRSFRTCNVIVHTSQSYDSIVNFSQCPLHVASSNEIDPNGSKNWKLLRKEIQFHLLIIISSFQKPKKKKFKKI